MFRVSHFVVRLLVLAALLLPAGAAAQSRDAALLIPAGQTYAGNLATITRDIRVEGVVTGDVTSWSGNIEVLGQVGGDVVSYGGQVVLRSGAQVGHNVLASGGALRQDTGASVTGQTIRGAGGGGALANLLDLFSPAATGGEATPIGRLLFGAALGVFLLAFSLLCVAFWPRRTAAAGLTLRRAPGRSLGLGLLTTLLLALALPPALALLAATLIGLPLIVLLLALVQAPYIYGLAALARTAGMPAQHSSVATQESGTLDRGVLLAASGLALLIGLSTALAPLWGLSLLYLVASPGLGAALLSRGGLFVPAYE